MALPAFDTHDYVKKLEAAGFSEKQAEVQAQLQSQVLSSLITEKLATKEDIKDLKNATKEDIKDLKSELTIIKWMMGFTLTGMMAIFVKLLLFHI